MVLPILAYGHPLLRQPAEQVLMPVEELQELIVDMWDTLYNANGCGLAAPQLGRSLRLFLVDSRQTYERMDENERRQYFDGDEGIRQAFINPVIRQYSAGEWTDEEGCLSIPHLQQPVRRPWTIEIDYLDEQGSEKTGRFSGVTARMIQHEYDHIEGMLYLDRIGSLQRKLLAGKLRRISRGQWPAPYPMKFF
ncbi:MAG TPA: peptide deformylase [Flavisolibacter sp.]|nr:peptide deformylase [Flavisolibacter sp.]